jgi:hypothetical protein
MVIVKVVERATARAVGPAFGETLVRFGAPEEMLTDNGKQFTARFGSSRPSRRDTEDYDQCERAIERTH